MDKDRVIQIVENAQEKNVIQQIKFDLRQRPYGEVAVLLEDVCQEHIDHYVEQLAYKLYHQYQKQKK